MTDYEFVTIWRFKAPQEKVWNLIFHSEDWPSWWRGVERVEKLRDGNANSVGAVHRYTWKSKLPYRLVFEMETTRVEPIHLIEGRAIGELREPVVGDFRMMVKYQSSILTMVLAIVAQHRNFIVNDGLQMDGTSPQRLYMFQRLTRVAHIQLGPLVRVLQI